MHHLDIRKTFLDYFAARDHTLVAPSNIIPGDDPTLLFTNAGMNQFKDALLGREKRSYSRAISVQPCMRVGGKHNDLDAVGKDGRHNTWFEMLGNWSFGDYYKEDAIAFAWDLVTREWGIDKSRLYASVYKDDDAAVAIWKKVSGLPDDRIVRLGDIDKGDEENFWSMGPTGPCGPCTELYFDQGEALGEDVVGGHTDRYLEFWNLVFMEFDRDEAGAMLPLPMKSVDTGLGLERMAAILQGKTNIFHTDLFAGVIERIANLTARDFTGGDAPPMCVVADHVRGLTFVLNDGGEFDRVGRGYVLRRILRRAVLHGDQLGMKEPWLHELVPAVVETTAYYAIAADRQAEIAGLIRAEEEKFFATLDRGLVYFRRAIDRVRARGDGIIDGGDAFQLYDTYGFPVDLTRILAEKEEVDVDLAGFEANLQAQRKRSKEAQEFYDPGGWNNLSKDKPGGFAGYDIEALDVTVLRYRRHDDDALDVILDRTPFYIEGGGEEADHGRLVGEGIELAVTDVSRGDVGIVHACRLVRGDEDALAGNASLRAEVDTGRRQAKAAHHTATHLLHAALREVLGPKTRQMGSLVSDDHLRFDFACDRAPAPEELSAIESMANRWVVEDHTVEKIADVPYQEALDRGALAFFQENYGDKVRMLDISGVSTELCGGNHVNRTGEIGQILVVGVSSIGAGVARVEAVAGAAALRRASEMRAILTDTAAALKITEEQIPGRVAQLLDEVRKLHKEKDKLAHAALSGQGAVSLEQGIETLNGIPVLVAAVAVGDPSSVKNAVDNLRSGHKDGLFVLIGESEGRGFIIVGVGADAITDHGLDAGRLAGDIGRRLGSGGGGRADFAQTGFKGCSAEDARAVAREVVEAAIQGG